MNTPFSSSFWDARFLLIDSRQLVSAPNTIFFAIAGKHHDGHDYIHELYEQGVRKFVIEHAVDEAKFKDAQFKQVSHTITTLQQLVATHRKKFEFPVIGITGSNGKTTVKEWLYELLEPSFTIVKSPKSYNSQIGVPLSVWEIRAEHQLGIFEAGISQVGEMERLKDIILPQIGIFTNIGTAHREGFSSQELKIREKLKLFDTCKLLIYCRDHENIHQEALNLACNKRTWGEHPSSDILILKKEKKRGHVFVYLTNHQQEFRLKLPFSDQASIENSLHCVAVMLELNLSIETIQHRISSLHNVAMRLELKQGTHQCLIVDDTYNNDLAGLAVALDFMGQQDDNKSRTVILSDILEAGDRLDKIYAQANELMKSKRVERFIGIGSSIMEAHHKIDIHHKTFYPSVAAFLAEKPKFNNELILIKGARNFELEQVVHRLQQKVHGTRLEINLEALVHNLSVYRSLLKPETKIMVMVKAFAYGSGGYEVARLLQYHRVDYLAVAYADEGVELRQKGIKLPIMVMNPSPETFDKIVEFELEPEVYNFRILHSLNEYLHTKKLAIKVHLKLDTGMHRLGFEPHDMEQLIAELQSIPKIKIQSAFTHLAGSDEAIHNDYSKQQLAHYQRCVDKLEQALGYSFIKHALNSPGITRFPEHQFDMVRLGIGLYGVDTNKLYQGQLQAVGTLKTTISQIRTLKAGVTVGYSRKWKLKKESQIAVMSIGYADGYDRRFSNGVGQGLVNGQLVPVVGNVCMDMTMLDVTEVDAKEGDEVILFGKEPAITNMAEAIGTIPYEILTNVSDRVKRVFYQE